MYIPSFTTDARGVPVLSKLQIEYIAERFIKDFCPEALKEPRPIDIDSFVMNYLKLKQDFQYLSHCGLYLGMMVFNDTNMIPVYNPHTNSAEYISAREGTIIIDNTLLENDQERRYRFTVGHEGSHWICHRNVLTADKRQFSIFQQTRQAVIQCRAVSIEGKVKPYHLWNDSDRMEWQANYMTSAIMMPRPAVLAVYNKDWLKQMRESEDSFDRYCHNDFLIDEVAAEFNASYQAAGFRLKNLGLINDEKYAQGLLAGARL